MKGNILAPTGAAPASGELAAPASGTKPQFVADATKSPQQIRKEFESNRQARAANLKAEVVPGEETPDSAASAASDAPAAEAGEGDPAGTDVTSEAESAEALQARITKAAAKARSASARNKSMQQEIARRDADLARMRQHTANLEAQARRGAAFEREMMQDPIKALQDRNVTPEMLAQKVMLAGTPEEKFALLQQQVKAQQDRADALERNAAAERSRAQHSANLVAAEKTFVELATNAEKYPNLVGHPRQAILAMGKQIAQEAIAKYKRDYGTDDFKPTDRQILGYMNRLYTKEATETVTPATPSKAAAKPSGKASPKPASPRTMTSGQSAGSFSRPTNWESLTRAQKVAAMRQEVTRNR